MKTKSLFFFLLLGIVFTSAGEPGKLIPLYPVQNSISLNGEWKFKYIPALTVGTDSFFYRNDFDVSDWKTIKVPGNWELQGFATPNYKKVDEGTGLYRTTFSLPSPLNKDRLFIRFEGVQYAYDVFLNGGYVGSWASSYNATGFEITGKTIFPGENILAVRVSTRTKGYQFDINDCWAISGIFREVALITTPETYIGDYTVRTYLNSNSSASVKINTKIQDSEDKLLGNFVLKASLVSPEGKIAGNKTLENISQENLIELNIENPELWTAESPSLYHLTLSLLKGGKEIQKLEQKVGIREIAIENAVLKLNGQPVKLRGADHHDIVPETGRAMSKQDILRDLMLMKKANINFIRTSHYPPDRRLLDFCDSLGFYVDCEVPFGFGDSFLTDTSYQQILIKRASATVLRDKNHPSIIIWSIGNENPMTPITEATGHFVKQTDPTRPVCFPQMGSYFNGNYKNFSEIVEIYTPHYEQANWVKAFDKETTRPVIMTEYAHSMGLSFGNMASIWNEMFRSKKFAGGAVWHFQDQGILRKAVQPVDTTQLTPYVWIDSLRYYDTNGNEGVDGIVYSDRTPQPDYWFLRNVYSPVRIIENQTVTEEGKKEIPLTFYNQYDFTNLNALSGKWKLIRGQKTAGEGLFRVGCAPHDTVTFSVPAVFNSNPGNDIQLLRLEFTDKTGMPVYEHSVVLNPDKTFAGIKNKIDAGSKPGELKTEAISSKIKVETGNFVYEFGKSSLATSLQLKDKNTPLISSGIYARAGRKTKITDLTIRDRHFPENNDYFWDPYLLEPSEVKPDTEAGDDGFRLTAKTTFLRGNNFPGQKLEGEIRYTVKSNGALRVSYSLKPENATGVFLEAGVSFILSPEITNFFWAGDGPYASYPDKKQENFGIYSMNKNDIHFNGNRSNVEIAILTDDNGNGIAILGDKANISAELSNSRIIVSHNALLTGMSNKKTMPSFIVRAQDNPEIKGEFEIIPLKQGNWPEELKKVFGYPIKPPVPFRPFYYSYDTSK